MAAPRIPTKPNALRDQLIQAATGIGGEANWPATAPTQAEVNTLGTDMHTLIANVDSLKAQLATARAALRAKRDDGVATMKKIDAVTDGLYGPDGTQKENFGLPPKKSPGGPSVPLGQVVITKVADGTAPASIFVDWDPEEGAAAYQIEWFMNSITGTPVGNAAVSESEFEIHGLISKQQYWIHVRAIRGSEYGTWSDPATRVANL